MEHNNNNNNNNNNSSDYEDIINSLLNNFSNQVNNLSNNTGNTARPNNLTQPPAQDTLFESVLNSRNNDIRATVNETIPLRATRNPNRPLSYTFSGSPADTTPTPRQETIPQLPERF